MKKDSIIRVGDWIEIVEPHIFVRCGYPKTVDDAIAELEAEHGEAIKKFVKDMGLSIFPPYSPYGTKSFHSDVYERVRRAVAYAKLKAERFGGSAREIHTKYDESKKGKRYYVCDIRFVKTGFYCAGGWSGGMDGYEYEPAELTEQKTHKILRIGYFPDMEIEAIHVKKLDRKPEDQGVPVVPARSIRSQNK